jgi:hypothetical protein
MKRYNDGGEIIFPPLSLYRFIVHIVAASRSTLSRYKFMSNNKVKTAQSLLTQKTPHYSVIFSIQVFCSESLRVNRLIGELLLDS